LLSAPCVVGHRIRTNHTPADPPVHLALALAVLLVGGGCGSEELTAPAPDAAAPPVDASAPPDAPEDAPAPEDAGQDLAPLVPDAPAPYPRPTYHLLAETGLFQADGQTPAGDLLAFEPAYPLWSDGTAKRRWVRLPPGTQIDTSEMDHWQFPVGTKIWKEFSRNGVLLETRLIERYGTGRDDYWMGAFVWKADRSEAMFQEMGAADINGSGHDAPAAELCGSCHRGDKGRVLGLSALQLGQPGIDARPALSLAGLAGMGRLSHPPPPDASYAVPGDATTAAALGYLHANCGHCHNPQGTSYPDTQMVLRLRVSERSAPASDLWQTVVGQRLQSYRHPTLTLRVAPGDADQSALLARMKIRGTKEQMPSLATKLTDPAGIDAITRWITSLPPP
jgi:hypothetical protein